MYVKTCNYILNLYTQVLYEYVCACDIVCVYGCAIVYVYMCKCICAYFRTADKNKTCTYSIRDFE